MTNKFTIHSMTFIYTGKLQDLSDLKINQLCSKHSCANHCTCVPTPHSHYFPHHYCESILFKDVKLLENLNARGKYRKDRVKGKKKININAGALTELCNTLFSHFLCIF